MDPVAPFLHEFTYQAMVNDLLPIDDEGKTYKCAFFSIHSNPASACSDPDVVDSSSFLLLLFPKDINFNPLSANTKRKKPSSLTTIRFGRPFAIFTCETLSTS
jgi:hypothetical protein